LAFLERGYYGLNFFDSFFGHFNLVSYAF
jgi:hypothetical protein